MPKRSNTKQADAQTLTFPSARLNQHISHAVAKPLTVVSCLLLTLLQTLYPNSPCCGMHLVMVRKRSQVISFWHFGVQTYPFLCKQPLQSLSRELLRFGFLQALRSFQSNAHQFVENATPRIYIACSQVGLNRPGHQSSYRPAHKAQLSLTGICSDGMCSMGVMEASIANTGRIVFKSRPWREHLLHQHVLRLVLHYLRGSRL